MKFMTWAWCPNCLDREDHDLKDLRWICHTCKQLNTFLERRRPVTFEEFLAYVREHIGTYCTDAYWKANYDRLKDFTREELLHEMAFLAVNAIATDYATREILSPKGE